MARALVSGPPATPNDLREIVLEVLADLQHDIRHGDTSPWRAFWNNPGAKFPERSPKGENDCRDLITDRLRDRLLRFGVHAKRVTTEARSAADRRVDLIVIGEREAALPIEAKRHMNPEIWTAPKAQLEDYATSAKSGRHGIYLVFWYGLEPGHVPKPPLGRRIETPAQLQVALQSSLKEQHLAEMQVVVLDVSASDSQGALLKAKKAKKAKKSRNARGKRTEVEGEASASTRRRGSKR